MAGPKRAAAERGGISGVRRGGGARVVTGEKGRGPRRWTCGGLPDLQRRTGNPGGRHARHRQAPHRGDAGRQPPGKTDKRQPYESGPDRAQPMGAGPSTAPLSLSPSRVRRTDFGRASVADPPQHREVHRQVLRDTSRPGGVADLGLGIRALGCQLRLCSLPGVAPVFVAPSPLYHRFLSAVLQPYELFLRQRAR